MWSVLIRVYDIQRGSGTPESQGPELLLSGISVVDLPVLLLYFRRGLSLNWVRVFSAEIKMPDTFELLQTFSGTAKETLIQSCLVYPETEDMRSGIDRAAALETTIKYDNLVSDFDRIVSVMNGNPRFMHLQTNEICIELLKSMISLGEANSILSNVDFILFHRSKIPVLCLQNENIATKFGTSAFIELSEVRIKVHRIVDTERPTIQFQTILSFFVFFLAVYAAFLK
jgi:hypothetical protein